MKTSGLIVAAITIFIAVFAIVGSRVAVERERTRGAAARTQVERWAETLDGRTTESGAYDRHPGPRLPESDPWGRPLEVAYTQGGLAEVLKVRSVGKDGVPFSEDDLVAVRHSVNLKGVGAGITRNAEETSARVARGAVRGIREGLTPGFLKMRHGRGDDGERP